MDLTILSRFLVSVLQLFIHLHGVVAASTREYYIAAVEMEWDYAPSGFNRIRSITLEDDSQAVPVTQRGVNRMGNRYKKVLYREYTDGTFTTQKAHPEHLGFLGPTIKGELGDTIMVHFKNMALRPFSMHAHGIHYDKASEGSVYADHSKEEHKKDDQVEPGQTHEYIWQINENHSPAESDGDCVTRMYHSHVVSPKDTNTGLIGVLVICKEGVIEEGTDKIRNVDREFPLIFTVMDENESWLLQESIDEYSPNSTETRTLLKDPDFIKSNRLASINGFLHGNLPGLNMCHGDMVSWHLIGLGTYYDMHTPSFNGHTVKIESHRTNSPTLLPSTFKTAYMEALNPGTWLLHCMDDLFFEDGMSALFNVNNCGNSGSSRKPMASGGKTRYYFVAAEEVTWDYGPTGLDNIDGVSLTSPGSESAKYFTKSDIRLGGRYLKALYIEYVDQNFTVKKNRSSEESHLGFLGPVIRAEVGDVINVVFKNKASRNYSIHPLGVYYDKANEGAMYEDGTSGNDTADNSIMPNETFVYRWTVPEEVGPTESDPQCLTWIYHSGVDPTKDKHSGLIGPLLTCKKGTLTESGKQKNIDHEFILRFAETSEAMSWYFDENKNLSSNRSRLDETDAGFQTSNKMRNVNGYMFANLPGLRMCKGDVVSWHLIGGPGSHAAYFYGNTLTRYGNNIDTVALIPGSLATAHMIPDNAGEWKLVCRVNSNIEAGMSAKYTVREDCGKAVDGQRGTGKKRWYYIAAIEDTWDYTPSGDDKIEGVPLTSSSTARYTVPGPHYIGSKNKKVMYREFTDATFTKQKPRSHDQEHLGILGPMIKAEVGDTIEILFKNLGTRYYSMHPHGMFYSKKDEGSSYHDNTTGSDTADNAIPPGKVYNYEWEIPERAGPGPDETGCLTWGYYSDVNPVKDTNSGLVGPIVICKPGTLNQENKRTDVDREFAVLFATIDENNNWFLDENIEKYLTEDPGPLDQLKSMFDFWESNLKGAINGYLAGNVPGLQMYKNEKVVWYLLQIGGMTEMHTVHFHGQTVVYKSSHYHRGDVYDLLPESFATVEMTPDAIGTWMLHCHVNIHITGGMRALFTVMAPTEKPRITEPPPAAAGWSVLTAHVIPVYLSLVGTLLGILLSYN